MKVRADARFQEVVHRVTTLCLEEVVEVAIPVIMDVMINQMIVLPFQDRIQSLDVKELALPGVQVAS